MISTPGSWLDANHAACGNSAKPARESVHEKANAEQCKSPRLRHIRRAPRANEAVGTLTRLQRDLQQFYERIADKLADEVSCRSSTFVDVKGIWKGTE